MQGVTLKTKVLVFASALAILTNNALFLKILSLNNATCSFFYSHEQCNFVFLSSLSSAAAKKIVQSHIGAVTSVSVRLCKDNHLQRSGSELGWRVNVADSGGGLFADT
jgi:hypothetical protein